MVTKEQVITELKRLAEELGRPPGTTVFHSRTGISPRSIVGRLWRTWSEALSDAGLSPNQLQQALDKDDLLSILAKETRELGRFPTSNDLRFAARNKPDFPANTTFDTRLGRRSLRVSALREWIDKNPDFQDILPLIPASDDSEKHVDPSESFKSIVITGNVYMYKGRTLYYIGQTKDLDRRKSDHKRYQEGQLTFIHVIETDDPAGIEEYWHKRFKDKNDHGDWFALDPEDIAAFKRRKYQ